MKRQLFLPGLVAASIAASSFGCSDDVTTLDDGADAIVIIDTGSSGEAADGGVDPAPTPDGGVPEVDGGFPELDGGPRACGARNGRPCLATEYCDFGDNNCGAFDVPGVCQPRPEGCTGVFEPVCGCGGTVFPTACSAAQAGVDVNVAGCAQDGLIACGWRMCEAAGQYCQVSISDVVGVPDDYACRPAPIQCLDAVTCECLADEPCGEFCTRQPDGALRLECPGG